MRRYIDIGAVGLDGEYLCDFTLRQAHKEMEEREEDIEFHSFVLSDRFRVRGRVLDEEIGGEFTPIRTGYKGRFDVAEIEEWKKNARVELVRFKEELLENLLSGDTLFTHANTPYNNIPNIRR